MKSPTASCVPGISGVDPWGKGKPDKVTILQGKKGCGHQGEKGKGDLFVVPGSGRRRIVIPGG